MQRNAESGIDTIGVEILSLANAYLRNLKAVGLASAARSLGCASPRLSGRADAFLLQVAKVLVVDACRQPDTNRNVTAFAQMR